MATGDLTTLTAVKEWLEITDGSQDALLSRLITAASTAIQNSLNRPSLVPTVYEGVFDGTGGTSIVPKNYPITDVASVAVDGAPVSLDRVVWDAVSISLTAGTFPRGRSNVRITYTAGQPVPADVEQACLLTVQAMFGSLDLDPNLSSESGTGYSSSFRETAGAIPPAAKALLSQYRRVF
ncbi:phage head-tail connector protein [Azospirillum sp. TSO5]|uniref:phage head-tail connector protein n=1 Tax=Azospirillum sp. TSO5 TaxID=716760 RepID=UPI000D65DB96|nr:phage head-tail connector protein [Azospirillum sp. TSO5]